MMAVVVVLDELELLTGCEVVVDELELLDVVGCTVVVVVGISDDVLIELVVATLVEVEVDGSTVVVGSGAA
jgi:hypothetical protein